MGIEVGAGGVDQAVRVGLQHARDEPFAHQFTLAVAAVRVETVADDGLAVANDVGDHGHEAQGHFAEVDVGVADWRANRYGFFADLDDFQGMSPGGCKGWFSSAPAKITIQPCPHQPSKITS
jgi:hypothetical protein